MLPRRPPPRPDPRARRLEIALCGLAVAGPDADFQLRLRTRLLAVGAVQTAAVAVPRRRAVSRRVPGWLPRAVAAGAAGVVGVAGVGVATSRALPGQPLYAAKRQIESWQLSLASGPAARGREQLGFARTRLTEVEALSKYHDLTSAAGPSAGGSNDDRITTTLQRMDAETRAGTSDLAIAAHGGDDTAARQLLSFASGQSARLVDIAPALPAPVGPAVDTSRSVLRQVVAVARALPGAPVDPAPPPPAGPSLVTAPSAGRLSPSPAASPAPPSTGGAPPSRGADRPSARPTRPSTAPPTWWRWQPPPPPPPTDQPSDPTLLGVPPSAFSGLLGGQDS
ncbi:MAG TPA: DUF5667 domain-containing protein [Mycobacteriales bacterium]